MYKLNNTNKHLSSPIIFIEKGFFCKNVLESEIESDFDDKDEADEMEKVEKTKMWLKQNPSGINSEHCKWSEKTKTHIKTLSQNLGSVIKIFCLGIWKRLFIQQFMSKLNCFSNAEKNYAVLANKSEMKGCTLKASLRTQWSLLNRTILGCQTS